MTRMRLTIKSTRLLKSEVRDDSQRQEAHKGSEALECCIAAPNV